jgi:uncharacterized cysteine cluster protein YcgN (CxxCxxCC family)
MTKRIRTVCERIRAELKCLGLEHAIVSDIMVDNCPAVLLRYNDTEEVVTLYHFLAGKDEVLTDSDYKYQMFLRDTFDPD